MSATLTKAPRPHVFWEYRAYTGGLADLSEVRADLARDLSGFDPGLVETVQLCASELFANGAKYARPGGEVVRTLSMPDTGTLRLTVSDPGGPTLPHLPAARTEDEWHWAEGQRGLLLVENLSREWAYFSFAPWADLGTHVWAAFDVGPAGLPDRLCSPVLAD